MTTLDDSGIVFDLEELRVVTLAINTLGEDGHPWPDAQSIPRLDAVYVKTCLERALRFAGDIGIPSEDVRVARVLVARLGG